MSDAMTELAMLLGALVGGTVIATVAGATNLGTALTFGVLAFMATLMYVLLKRP